ncbi:Hypothetical predicted protein [Mytilus galloprovincialis]|uniref:Uncharacterized protein n=1 Tax=Mytilus galloprovincialis TaxID=29158 RepID=A0A8B6DB00_MYTGA|nr:Hypothetical predicted protein [Mytilus galloprovincialis]
MVSTNVEGDGTASRDVKIASAPLQEPATKNHYPVLDIGFDHWTQRRRLDMVDHMQLDFRRWMVDHMQVGVFDDEWWITCKLDFRRWMVDHMQVGVFDDEWWITCRLDFRRWMVDHMQVGFSTMDGGSHAGWSLRR